MARPRQANYTLPFGQLVGKTIGIYLRNLLPFAVLGAIVLAPWIVLRIYMQESMGEATYDGSQSIAGMDVASFALQTLLGYVLTGAVTYGVVQQLRGQPAGLGQVIGIGVQSFFRVLLTGVVVGVLVGLATMLLIVPGIIVSVILFVAIPAAVMERAGPGDAIGRSADLTKGSRWLIFAAWLLIALIGIGVAAVAGGVVAIFAVENQGLHDGIPMWLEIAITILTTPFSATMAAVCYFMLRMGKENVDVKELAAVFD
jgi:hypothetical protein